MGYLNREITMSLETLVLTALVECALVLIHMVRTENFPW